MGGHGRARWRGSTELTQGSNMPRRREVPKREILPDPKFGSVELAKFMNVVMLDGKKAVAERIVYGALEQVQTKTGKEPIEVFSLAINNIKPIVEVKSRSEEHTSELQSLMRNSYAVFC